jgi:hypothetical protein
MSKATLLTSSNTGSDVKTKAMTLAYKSFLMLNTLFKHQYNNNPMLKSFLISTL